MGTSLKIQEFNTLLNTGGDADTLLAVLRKLRSIECPERVTTLLLFPEGSWFGWDLPQIGQLATTK
jgi:hypothetical protein